MSNGETVIQPCIRKKAVAYTSVPDKTGRRYIKIGLAVLLVLGTILACAAVIYYWDYLQRFRNWGYPGAFIFGLIAGSSLPFPLPYLVITFSLGGLLNPLLVGLASGLGAGIGGTLVYLFGRGSRHVLHDLFHPHPDEVETAKGQRLFQRLANWSHCRGTLVVFLMSAILNPLFAPMAITAGAMRFGFRRFLFWCVLGNVMKSTAIAYCGYFGLTFILRWTGG